MWGFLYFQVKFMKTIPGTALVEMGDEYAVERAVTHLKFLCALVPQKRNPHRQSKS